MQYLMCKADMGYELSWLLISLSSYDSRDSCKMFIRKARGAAVEMCSVRRRAHLPGSKESGNFICLSFLFLSEGLCDPMQQKEEQCH